MPESAPVPLLVSVVVTAANICTSPAIVVIIVVNVPGTRGDNLQRLWPCLCLSLEPFAFPIREDPPQVMIARCSLPALLLPISCGPSCSIGMPKDGYKKVDAKVKQQLQQERGGRDPLGLRGPALLTGVSDPPGARAARPRPRRAPKPEPAGRASTGAPLGAPVPSARDIRCLCVVRCPLLWHSCADGLPFGFLTLPGTPPPRA